MADFDAVRIGIQNAFQNAAHRITVAADQIADAKTRPSVLFCPTCVRDGNKWVALYGSNLMEGVCGVGDSPAEAMADFDRAWKEKMRDDPRHDTPDPWLPHLDYRIAEEPHA